MDKNDVLKMSGNLYGAIPALLDSMPMGFAVMRVLIDEDDEPFDLIYEYANNLYAYLENTSLESLMQYSWGQLFPDEQMQLFGAYANIALNGGSRIIEQKEEGGERKLRMHCYQPAFGFCAMIVEEVLVEKPEIQMPEVDDQMVTQLLSEEEVSASGQTVEAAGAATEEAPQESGVEIAVEEQPAAQTQEQMPVAEEAPQENGVEIPVEEQPVAQAQEQMPVAEEAPQESGVEIPVEEQPVALVQEYEPVVEEIPVATPVAELETGYATIGQLMADAAMSEAQAANPEYGGAAMPIGNIVNGYGGDTQGVWGEQTEPESVQPAEPVQQDTQTYMQEPVQESYTEPAQQEPQVYMQEPVQESYIEPAQQEPQVYMQEPVQESWVEPATQEPQSFAQEENTWAEPDNAGNNDYNEEIEYFDTRTELMSEEDTAAFVAVSDEPAYGAEQELQAASQPAQEAMPELTVDTNSFIGRAKRLIECIDDFNDFEAIDIIQAMLDQGDLDADTQANVKKVRAFIECNMLVEAKELAQSMVSR